MATIAKFVNFSDKIFTGYWNGKGKTYKPGQSEYMQAWKAEHFATGLANQILVERNREGELVIPGGDTFTSPKNPDQVPVFKGLFDQAFIPQKDEDTDETSLDDEEIAENMNRQKPDTLKQAEISSDLPIVDSGSESEFGGKPKED